jgi:hypothetical protein
MISFNSIVRISLHDPRLTSEASATMVSASAERCVANDGYKHRSDVHRRRTGPALGAVHQT